MGAQELQAYLDAKSDLDRARERVAKLATLLSEVGSTLKNRPLNIMVSNVNVGFPPEVALDTSIPSIDGQNWPSGQHIAEALAALHDTTRKANSTFSALSETDRKNVRAPD